MSIGLRIFSPFLFFRYLNASPGRAATLDIPQPMHINKPKGNNVQKLKRKWTHKNIRIYSKICVNTVDIYENIRIIIDRYENIRINTHLKGF